MYCHNLKIPAKYHDNRLNILTWDQFLLSYAILPRLSLCIHLLYILYHISYTLNPEYRVVRNRYTRLLFTSEFHLCANLCVQEQSTNMTSQYQYPTFAWRHGSTAETSEKFVLFSDNGETSDRWLFLAELWVRGIKYIVRNKIIHSLPRITILWSLVMRVANDFHLRFRHSWKLLANRLTRDPSPCGPRIHESSVSVLVGNGKHQSGHWATVTL